MTHAERIRIFRPLLVKSRLDRAEQGLLLQVSSMMAQQAEGLAIQYGRGVKPANLALDRRNVAAVSYPIASMLINAFSEASSAIRFEIQEAYNLRRGKPAVFAAIRRLDDVPGAEAFYPRAGVDWYRGYGLRLVGVQQQAALEAAKRAVIEGIEQGLDQRAVMARLSETFTTFGRHRLETIARTETGKIYEQARLVEMGGNDDIVGYEVSEILDSRICPICAARDGRRFPKDQVEGNCPLYHVGCRGTLLPIFRWEIEDGSVGWNPIPGDAPKVQRGFGTTAMTIPEPTDKATRRLILAAGRV